MTPEFPLDNGRLAELQRKYGRGRYAPRVRFLQILNSDPEISRSHLAERVGCSASSIDRFRKILNAEGVDALFPKRYHAGHLSYSQREEVVAAARNGIFSSYRDTVEWVMDRFGVKYTIPGIRKLLGTAVTLHKRMLPEQRGSTTELYSDPFTYSLPVTLLNCLPVTSGLEEWTQGFRAFLAEIFPQAEYIFASLNRSSKLDGSGRMNVGTIFVKIDAEEVNSKPEHASIDRRFDTYLAKIEGSLRKRGVNPARLYPPVHFEAFIGVDDRVGRLTLFFSRKLPDPSGVVEDILEKMRPFLTFVISDGVARDIVARPQHRTFQSFLVSFASHYDLSIREREVLMFYLRGESASDIADSLGITAHTVRGHIRGIYRKTKVSSRNEIIGLLLDGSL